LGSPSSAPARATGHRSAASRRFRASLRVATLLDQRRLYSAEPARCTLPPRRSHASSPHPITNPTMTFTLNPTHDIHIYFSTPTMTLSLAGEP
jgi:hypothetical protein